MINYSIRSSFLFFIHLRVQRDALCSNNDQVFSPVVSSWILRCSFLRTQKWEKGRGLLHDKWITPCTEVLDSVNFIYFIMMKKTKKKTPVKVYKINTQIIIYMRNINTLYLVKFDVRKENESCKEKMKNV